jgi:SAM-dependent methyltransferase
MNQRTRKQLHALSLAFYEAHAEAFDASRIDLPWPGWAEVLCRLPRGPLQVLDVGCGNGRFARYLHEHGPSSSPPFEFDYIGTDANAALLAAAQERLGPELGSRCEWRKHDFLSTPVPGSDLPSGPFTLIGLMGVLHHVPGREARRQLLDAAAERLAPGGLLAFTTWQFEGRPRFERRKVAWDGISTLLGAPIDSLELDPGDHLLRFGDDPTAPPRYCHQVSDEEFAGWLDELGLERVAEFRADGAQGDLNRYGLLRRN